MEDKPCDEMVQLMSNLIPATYVQQGFEAQTRWKNKLKTLLYHVNNYINQSFFMLN